MLPIFSAFLFSFPNHSLHYLLSDTSLTFLNYLVNIFV
uniref:Uncharacterized protein n=1 Tax=Siphoviridae sp. ctBAZ2 TaxID=2827801 RepID=A0A8S5S7P4_9CAUD|nr:MAG TPA: hypothetical protein [Siphoviridae sp. ctBAZ2]